MDENKLKDIEERLELAENTLRALSLSDRYVFTKLLAILDGKNIQLGTGTGTKIGTAVTQKLGLWGVTLVVQQATIVNADGNLADITTKFNTLLSQLEAIGLNASS